MKARKLRARLRADLTRAHRLATRSSDEWRISRLHPKGTR